MKHKAITISFAIILLVSLVGAYQIMPGGPKNIFSHSPLRQPHHPIGTEDTAPFPIDYNSFFYTFLEAHIFSYHNGTNFSGFWTGTLNQDEYNYSTTSAGIYSITGSEPYTLLSGQALVAGFFAKDEDGKGVSNKFLTYMPDYNWGGEKFIVFSYTNGTSVVVTDLTNGDTLLTTTLDDGQRAELTSTAWGKWLKVEASNQVSVLSYGDQEYNVPARTGPFVGTDFYTWVGFIGDWQNDLNIVAWHDATNYLVTSMDTGDTLASGMLNNTEIGCIQTIQDQYVRVTTDKKVSVSVAPYLSWSGSGYARFSTMRDSTGFGAGNYFVFPVNGAGDNVHVVSFKDNNFITVTDLDENTDLWSGTLNAGQDHATTISGFATRIKVVSSDLASVDVYYYGYGADFAPLEFAAPGHDVGVTQILAPTGTIPAGTLVTPKAVVHNFSSYTETFPVKFEFTGYSNSQTVSNLAPGATDTVEFDPWTAVAGSYNTMAYSQLAGDQDLSNDTAYSAFEVFSGEVHDVGATTIIAPVGTILQGTIVTPISVIENFGTETEMFWVKFDFGTYSDSVKITLAAGLVDTVEFTPWTAVLGSYNTMSYTMLDGDANLSNDTAHGAFEVISEAGHDVGVISILEPLGTITEDSTVTPTAEVKNFGAFDEDFFVFFTIGCIYSDFRYIHLAAGQTTSVFFNQWDAVAGYYNEGAATYLEGDENPTNNAMSDWLTVSPEEQNIAENNTPLNYELFRPYPNPTANNLSIRFALPNPSNVEIAIYDVNGRVVNNLVSETRAAGTYRINMDCRELGNGVYIVKMKADNFKAIEKFVVTK
jgi:hypothetical protein